MSVGEQEGTGAKGSMAEKEQKERVFFFFPLLGQHGLITPGAGKECILTQNTAIHVRDFCSWGSPPGLDTMVMGTE